MCQARFPLSDEQFGLWMKLDIWVRSFVASHCRRLPVDLPLFYGLPVSVTASVSTVTNCVNSADAPGAQSTASNARTRMNRRGLLTAIGLLALGEAAHSAAPDAPDQPGYKVSAEQLQRAVAQRFPRRYPVAGLFDLTVQTPQLRLLPELNRLASEMAVQAAGPMLGRSYSGVFDLDFALRYEASDRTLRAHRLRVNALRFAELPPDLSQLLNAYRQALAEQSLLEVVLHQLRPQDLVLPDAMGLQPGSITVTSDGLLIGFVAKPLP